MRVYAICSDGSRTEIAWPDGLKTVTALPEPEESPADDLRKLCHDVDFTVSIVSEIDSETMRRACVITDKLMDIARALARGAAIGLDEALYLIENLKSIAETSRLYDETRAYEDIISEHRAESMEPHPVIVIFPALEVLRRRSLHELYGQGVDAGPLTARPGLIRPADDGLRRAETGTPTKEDGLMKRLTTDHPQNNTETALNLFYVKDGEAWARGGGEAPNYPDARMYDFARRLIREHGVEEFMEPESDDAELGEQISETLFDGPDTTEGLVALLYTTAWAFAELREKLKQYEDAEEAGKLLWLPCKPGTTVYRYHIIWGNGNVSEEPFTVSTLPDFGSRVFLTREEATEAMEDQLKHKG